jgi:hypothetical protein
LFSTLPTSPSFRRFSAYWQVGIYTARILKSDEPTNLPINLPTMQPTQFEFVINL